MLLIGMIGCVVIELSNDGAFNTKTAAAFLVLVVLDGWYFATRYGEVMSRIKNMKLNEVSGQ